MIKINSVDISFEKRGFLFKDVDLQIVHGNRIGVVGRNGCGKSTLLQLINPHNTDTELSSGNIDIDPEITVAMVSQEAEITDDSPIDFLREDNSELQHLYDQLIDDTSFDEDSAFVSNKISEIEERYATESENLLKGLGFTKKNLQTPMKQLSLGLQHRVLIASSILKCANVLLLDEPTNHLDLPSIIFLQNYLKKYSGAVVIVSHDVNFLNQVTNKTWHIAGGKITEYKGNYNSFAKAFTRRQTQLTRENKKDEQNISAKLQFVSKFKARPSRAGQCGERMKQVKKLREKKKEIIQLPPVAQIDFQYSERHLGHLIQLKNATLSYGDKVVLSNVSLSIGDDSRYFVLGANGKGKSTLLKGLIGELKIKDEHYSANPKLRIAYYSQDIVGKLNVKQTLLAEFVRLNPGMNARDCQAFLLKRGFQREMLLRPIETLSGGEKARFSFSIIARQAPDLLILDEPTNHLDIPSQKALIHSIQCFKGALVIVSHNAEFLSAVYSYSEKSKLLHVDKGKVKLLKWSFEKYYKKMAYHSLGKNNNSLIMAKFGTFSNMSTDKEPGENTRNETQSATC